MKLAEHQVYFLSRDSMQSYYGCSRYQERVMERITGHPPLTINPLEGLLILEELENGREESKNHSEVRTFTALPESHNRH